MKRIRYWFVLKLANFIYLLQKLEARLDTCYICGDYSGHTCECCGMRHCTEHESFAYSDVSCCERCAPTKEEREDDWNALTEEEREDIRWQSGM